ncbi:2-hydroxy-3-oxopropionate reductase [Roseibium sp. TrichSKD4]|uniref:NAD(P)-dependent oxidoreductase n=1 Tax=Roseibium sp. TrichSKD4 TaxID=744980 RepID=UPI0001E56FB2|nr:NAD(P)-dependent oxidoreductase [Roseibium sp. TrichSKD4]EFO32096.1 2-hydroxy-3-oxopropionate reductase [Roseibium sp. TrichSKD4]
MSNPTIGFIGIGLMGAAMCNRLIDKGRSLVIVANRSRERVDALVGRGAHEVSTAREVAEASDIVMICIDTSASVEQRMQGGDGILAGLSNGKVVIDFGTSLPGSTRALGALVAEKGATYLDSPIGRTPSHALEGKLNLMCSGERSGFDKVLPVLEDVGENVFHLGALGTGHTIKLINNFYAQTVANAMAESFAIADKAGVDRQSLYDVMSARPLASGMMDFIKAYAIEGNPDNLAFSIKNARKDVGYYALMAEQLGVESLMATGAKQALGLSIASGRGEEFVPKQVDFFTELYGSTKAPG